MWEVIRRSNASEGGSEGVREGGRGEGGERGEGRGREGRREGGRGRDFVIKIHVLIQGLLNDVHDRVLAVAILRLIMQCSITTTSSCIGQVVIYAYFT